MRKRRSYQPSTGHWLVRLVSDRAGNRNNVVRLSDLQRRASEIAGPAIAEWAVPQLMSIPAKVRCGWAARRKKAVR